MATMKLATLFNVGDEVVERIGANAHASDKRTTLRAERDGMVLTDSGSWYDSYTGRLVQWKDGKGKWPEYAAIHHPLKGSAHGPWK